MRPNFISLGSYDGMHLIYEALKKTNGSTTADVARSDERSGDGRVHAGRSRLTRRHATSFRTSISAKWRRFEVNSTTSNLRPSRLSRTPSRKARRLRNRRPFGCDGQRRIHKQSGKVRVSTRSDMFGVLGRPLVKGQTKTHPIKSC